MLFNEAGGFMFVIYLIIGAFAGTMAGLLGIGGGVIIIPALAAVFATQPNIPTNYIMQMAIGTSLATVIITAISSMYAHHRHKAIQWSKVKLMIPGLSIGTILGVIIVYSLSSYFLHTLFALFLLLMGLKILFELNRTTKVHVFSQQIFVIGSFIIGFLSSLLGLGGGTLLVPFLMRSNLSIHQAISTSVPCGFVISVVATCGFMLTGWISTVHISWSTGYIYWPAFLGIVISSVLFAPLGATFAHKLPNTVLKRLFGVFLLLMAFDMVFFSK